MSRRGESGDLRFLLTAYGVSLFGSLLASGIVSWLAITEAHVSATNLGLILGGASAAAALVSLVIGSRVDGLPKRSVMIVLDLVAAAALVTLVVVLSLGSLHLLHLIAVSAIELSVGVLFASASAPLLKTVASTRLDWAAGRQESIFWTAQLLGPPLGGVLTSSAGAEWTILGNAVSFVLSAVVISRISASEPQTSAADTSGRPGVLAGARAIRGNRTLTLLYVNSITFGVSVMAASPVLALLMLRDLALPAWAYGLVLGLPCVGGVVAGPLVPRLVERFTRRRMLIGAGIGRTLWILPIALVTAGEHAVPTLIVLQTMLLFFAGLFNPVFAAVRIRVSPPQNLSAVVSTMGATSRVTQPMGMIAAGFLADSVGIRPTLAIAGVLCLVSGSMLLGIKQTEEAPAPAAEGEALHTVGELRVV